MHIDIMLRQRGTNWSSKYDITVAQNYFYIYKIICGMEQLSAELQFPLNMMVAKVKFFRKAIRARRWTKHKIKTLYPDCAYVSYRKAKNIFTEVY